MASCPACRRPVALARARCLYCGAPLPPEAVSPAAPASAAPPAEAAGEGGSAAGRADLRDERLVLVLDVAGVSADALARALGLPAYEAGLLVKRGGLHLHRVLEGSDARDEAGRLRASGLAVFLAPEAEVRVRPLRAVGGERGEGVMALRTEEGPLSLRRGAVGLVVRGAITREYQTPARRRRVSAARLEPGYRVHLYRHHEVRAVEIEAYAFEFGFALTGSARLELDAWVEEVVGDATIDDGFRRLPPALGPGETEPGGVLAAAGSLGLAARARRGARDEPTVVLDNVGQFRFYSGWRAAVERRR
jgi:hypothetical protein